MSPRWNWNSPTPLAASECALPPGPKGGGAHSPAAKGVGESQFRRLEFYSSLKNGSKFFLYIGACLLWRITRSPFLWIRTAVWTRELMGKFFVPTIV